MMNVAVGRGQYGRARKISLEEATSPNNEGWGCRGWKMLDPNLAAEEEEEEEEDKVRQTVVQGSLRHPGTLRLLVTAENSQTWRAVLHSPLTRQMTTGACLHRLSCHTLSTVTPT
jgi:hypothetical protein